MQRRRGELAAVDVSACGQPTQPYPKDLKEPDDTIDFLRGIRVLGDFGEEGRGLVQFELAQTFDQPIGAPAGERAETFAQDVRKFFAHFPKHNRGGTNAEFAGRVDPAWASTGGGFLALARSEQGFGTDGGKS